MRVPTKARLAVAPVAISADSLGMAAPSFVAQAPAPGAGKLTPAPSSGSQTCTAGTTAGPYASIDFAAESAHPAADPAWADGPLSLTPTRFLAPATWAALQGIEVSADAPGTVEAVHDRLA